jgi:hypothetical protein
MTPRFEIIPAKPWHCGAMVRRLRTEHALAVARLGLDSHRELADRFGQSAFRRALLIDGQLEALGGVTGSLLSSEGYVWLALSGKAQGYPLLLVRQARKQLEQIMTIKRVLVTSVLDEDFAAKRFAVYLGFVLADDDRAAPAASRQGRRSALRMIEGQHEARIPLGSGSAVALAYRAMEEA